jgi:outer membrane protein TolC
VAVADRSLTTTTKHVQQAQDLFDTGMLVESDLLQAQVQQAQMEERRIQATNAARLARAGLNRVLGTDQEVEWELEPESVELAADSLALATAIERGLATRGDIAAIAARTQAAGRDVSRAQGDLWPEVALVGKYAWNDDRFLGFNGESYTVFAVARWTPWNWGETQARIGRSRGARAAALQAQRAYNQQVEFEVREAWQSVGEANARHRVATRAVTAADRALAILEDRFAQGVARLTELLDAETLAHEARVGEAQARFDLQRAIRTVRFATGENPVPEIAEGGTTTP